MRNSLILMVALILTTTLFAQGAPGQQMLDGQKQIARGQQMDGGPQMGGPQMGGSAGKTTILNGNSGLFILRSGVLVKYTTDPLKLSLTAQLFGAVPEMPQDMTDKTAMQKYMIEMQKRMAPAVMIEKDNCLLIIIGDYYVRINETTLQRVTPSLDLRTTGQTADQQQSMRMNNAEPDYLIVDDTLYIIRNTELLSISITEGKITTRVALPKELQNTQMGNRGGNRQQNPPPPGDF